MKVLLLFSRRCCIFICVLIPLLRWKSIRRCRRLKRPFTNMKSLKSIRPNRPWGVVAFYNQPGWTGYDLVIDHLAGTFQFYEPDVRELWSIIIESILIPDHELVKAPMASWSRWWRITMRPDDLPGFSMSKLLYSGNQFKMSVIR